MWTKNVGTATADQEVTLHEFIGDNRDELIRRCQAKVKERSAPPAPVTGVDHGVPLFLDQLVVELRDGPSKTHEIHASASQHGRELLRQGFSVSEVVHDYGDVCQSVTDLAVEREAPIRTEDFRTLNRCLDDAIAGAVTEHARLQEVTRDGESHELRSLLTTALTAFEVLQSGSVGVGGTTAGMVHRSLIAARALIDRPRAEAAQPKPKPKPH